MPSLRYLCKNNYRVPLIRQHILIQSDSIFRLRTSLYPAPQHRSTKSSSLRAALLFAQDYGILAASVEDRPFVPQSYVIILSKPDGSYKAATIPEGMKTCFRKWTGDGMGQENVQILPLAEALVSEEH